MKLGHILSCGSCALMVLGLACAEVRSPEVPQFSATNMKGVADAATPHSPAIVLAGGTGGSASTARSPSQVAGGASLSWDAAIPGTPATPGTPSPALRSACVDGRCTCPIGDNRCQGECVSLDDAGTDTCEQTSESTNGCAPTGCPSISAVSAGDFHSCALLADHTVMCWGMNTLGENNSSIAKKTPPELVDGLTDIEVYQAGRAHTCFVRSTGPAQCFGINYQGELGDGTKSNTAQPVAVKLAGKPIAFGLGESHTCAVLSDGSVQCWGVGSFGELGDGTASDSLTPRPVPGLSGITAISARVSRTCVLSSDRTVSCWGGSRAFTGFNNPPNVGGAVSPRLVKNLDNVASIAAGENNACALRLDGTVMCWSYDDLAATSVENLHDVIALAGGDDSDCALLLDHTVKCWGGDRAGQLGDGITADSTTPVTVAGLKDVKLLAAGGFHYCAVKQDNSMRCWGAGRDYQLGNGVALDSNLPVAVRFPGG